MHVCDWTNSAGAAMINIFSNAFGSSETIFPIPVPHPPTHPTTPSPLLAAWTRSGCGDRCSMELLRSVGNRFWDIALNFLLHQSQDAGLSEEQFEARFCNQPNGLQSNPQNTDSGCKGRGVYRWGLILLSTGSHSAIDPSYRTTILLSIAVHILMRRYHRSAHCNRAL